LSGWVQKKRGPLRGSQHSQHHARVTFFCCRLGGQTKPLDLSDSAALYLFCRVTRETFCESQKTDARGVVSTYAYDALNRNTTLDYSDTASINPDVKRVYDGATNGIGRFTSTAAGISLTG
jgi:hypothetical protein